MNLRDGAVCEGGGRWQKLLEVLEHLACFTQFPLPAQMCFGALRKDDEWVSSHVPTLIDWERRPEEDHEARQAACCVQWGEPAVGVERERAIHACGTHLPSSVRWRLDHGRRAAAKGLFVAARSHPNPFRQLEGRGVLLFFFPPHPETWLTCCHPPAPACPSPPALTRRNLPVSQPQCAPTAADGQEGRSPGEQVTEGWDLASFYFSRPA